MRRAGRLALIAAVLLFGWAAVVAATGGFRIDLGLLRLSSRDPLRPALLGCLAAAVAWRVIGRAALDAWLVAASRTCKRLAPAVACALAAAVLVCGVRYGSRVAGGSDAFGYVSASALFAAGRTSIEPPAASKSAPLSAAWFVPLAYRLAPGNVIGPTVAPGLPLLMTMARAFSTCGPYLTVSLCGSLLVLATFVLGRQLFSTAAALAGAALVACSPVVLFQSLVVMPDVPAAAFWMGALSVASGKTTRGTLLAGVLAAVAILIRPNLLLLAVFPWLLAIARCSGFRTALIRSAVFAAGVVPGALFVAWLNRHLYGSPFASGYGDLGGAFAVAHAARNSSLYASWWLESQGITAFLFIGALGRRPSATRREAFIVMAYAAAGIAMYVFYLTFDQWWYLRFVIPSIPVMFLLCADTVDRATAWSPTLRTVALLAFTGAAAWHALTFIGSKDVFVNSEAERRRYLDTALFVDASIPAEAVVIAMQHSGSIRYYTGRWAMRWDVIEADALDAGVDQLRALGVPVFALLESWEEEDFRRRFAGTRVVAALAANAMARTRDGDVRLFEVFPSAARSLHTIEIPVTPTDRCVDGSPRFLHR